MLLLGTILCLVVQPHAAGRFDTLLQLRADETAYFADRLHASPLGVEKNYGSVAQRGVFATENNGNIREQRIWARKADNGYLNLRQSYDFDGLNRLTSMGETVLGGGSGGGSWTETNGYDRSGNRWAVNSGPQSYLTPMESGWIESLTNRVTVARLVPTGLGVVSYYGGGQLKSHPSVGVLLKWEVESQLRSVDGAQYFYDGEGQRVRKEVGGVTTHYALDGMGKLGAEYGGTPGSGGVRYLTVDHLGSTRVVTDGFGMVKARCDYSAFGEVLMGTAGVGNRNAIVEYGCGDGGVNQKFTSKERDVETGLDYFGARYLSGGMGRFVSADAPFADQKPGDAQSWNLYSYVRNNPLRHTDPTGHCIYANSDCFQYLIGGAKAVANTVPDTATLLNRGINLVSGAGLPDAIRFEAVNYDQKPGMGAAEFVIIFTPPAEAAAKAAGVARAAAKVERGRGLVTEVPKSIYAGPSARPTAAQQQEINKMGEAHGCSTCLSPNPKTTSGN